MGFTWRIETKEGVVLSPVRVPTNPSYRSRKDAATAGQAGCYYECRVVDE